MVSTTVNVARYTALFSGVFYGWYHRRTLQLSHDNHKLEEAAHNRERLVAEAKDAWKRKQDVAMNSSLVTNPNDPHFDLEKLLSNLEKDS